VTDEFRLTELGRYTEAREIAAAALQERGEVLAGLLRQLRPAADCGPQGWPMVRLDFSAIDNAVLALRKADGRLTHAVSDANHAADIVRRPALAWAR
jgi:hypothetical protein